MEYEKFDTLMGAMVAMFLILVSYIIWLYPFVWLRKKFSAMVTSILYLVLKILHIPFVPPTA
jgi:hypothetical protein